MKHYLVDGVIRALIAWGLVMALVFLVQYFQFVVSPVFSGEIVETTAGSVGLNPTVSGK